MYNYNEMPIVAGFYQLEIEKVCRISTMLEKMMDVHFLKERLALIGGTAINFIYTKPLARLSMDLDFNCRHIEKQDFDMDVFQKCAVVESMLIGKPKLNEINVNSPPWDSLLSDNLARMVNLENDIDYQAIKKDVLDFTQKIPGQLKENEIKMIETFYTQNMFNPDLIDNDGIFNEGVKDHPIIKWKQLKSNRK